MPSPIRDRNIEQTAPLRLVQLSDTHLLGAEHGTLRGIDTQQQLERVLEAAEPALQAADLVLLTGDLAEHGEAAAYARLARWMGRYPAAIAALPGNHDDPVRLSGRFPAPLDADGLALECGGWQLLLLDTTVAGASGGRLGKARLDWLERRLRDAGRGPVLVAIHHPPLPLDSPWMDAISLADGEALHARLAASGRVRGVLFGHAHQEFDRTRDGIRYLGCPATCVQFMPRTEQPMVDTAGRPGWRELTLHPDGGLETRVGRTG